MFDLISPVLKSTEISQKKESRVRKRLTQQVIYVVKATSTPFASYHGTDDVLFYMEGNFISIHWWCHTPWRTRTLIISSLVTAKNRIGGHKCQDNKRIGPLELLGEVNTGTILEMSIVLLQQSTLHENQQTCPRCRHINMNATASNG